MRVDDFRCITGNTFWKTLCNVFARSVISPFKRRKQTAGAQLSGRSETSMSYFRLLGTMLCLIFALPAAAATIGFDDIDASLGDVILGSYQGFTFQNFSAYTTVPVFPVSITASSPPTMPPIAAASFSARPCWAASQHPRYSTSPAHRLGRAITTIWR